MPILANNKGFKITEFQINIRKRKHGKSKYNLFRLYGGFMDLLTVKFFTSYSLRPLHLFGLGGLILVAFDYWLLGVLGISVIIASLIFHFFTIDPTEKIENDNT